MINAGIDSRQEAAKTAVIAGGTSGIGLATAIDLAKAGYRRLILNGRDAERGATAVELEALRFLRRKIELFLSAMEKEGCPSGDWRKLLEGKKLGYGGEVVGKAERLSLAQVALGLPPEGLGASVRAMDQATGRTREILQNPELIVKPVDEWPEETAQATIMAEGQEAI